MTPRSLEAIYIEAHKYVNLEIELVEKPHVQKNLEEKKIVNEAKLASSQERLVQPLITHKRLKVRYAGL